jgi:hypothetical protein
MRFNISINYTMMAQFNSENNFRVHQEILYLVESQ